MSPISFSFEIRKKIKIKKEKIKEILLDILEYRYRLLEYFVQ
jgi:hypothetical protein